MSNKIFFILLIYLLCCSRLLFAAPTITGVSGTIVDNSSVTVSGLSFGNGPNVELFDPFEGGITGNDIPINGARHGAWSSTGTYGPTYNATAHSGSHSMLITDQLNHHLLQFQKTFSSPCTEVFISYWVRIPDGTNFPCASEAATFGTGSCWKFVWLMDSADGYRGDDDMCIPTYYYTKAFGYMGNDYNPNIGLGRSWWSWTEWIRMTFWLKADPANPSTSNGTFQFQSLTTTGGLDTQTKTDKTVFNGDTNQYDDSTFQWTQINFPGWIGSTYATCTPVYDDIYIASGANAQARVEIGNNPIYNSCTNLSICTPTAWSENSITITLNQGSFANSETLFLFVVDADGNVNTKGYPITFIDATGAGPPSPPTFPYIASTSILGDDLDVTLKWYGNGEPDLDHYEVYWGPSSGSYTTDTSGDIGTVTTYTIQNLNKNQTHYIAVKAFDTEALESAYSIEVNTKAPQITSPPTVTAKDDTTATIEWNTDEPGTSVVMYKLLESGDPDDVKEVIEYVTTHSVTLTDLSPGTLYRYKVTSTDIGEAGPDISDSDNNPNPPAEYYNFTTTGSSDTTPPQITSPPTPTSVTDKTAIIEWQTDEPSTSVVQYDDTSSVWGNYLWSETDGSLVTNHSVTLTGLETETQYFFRVGSTDGFGYGPTISNEVTFTTVSSIDEIAPQITVPPTVTGITKTTAIIEWQTDEPGNSLVDYGLTTSYGSQAPLADYVTNHSVTLTGLTAGNTYHFRVSSTDEAGNGPDTSLTDNNPSTDVSFTTDPEPDTAAPQITSPPTVTNITGSTAVIEWETDEPSNSMVQYLKGPNGTTWGSYDFSENDAGMVTTHSVTLTGLTTGNYWFMVGSTDATGNGPGTSLIDNNPSAQQNFTIEPTPDTAAPVISNVIVAGKTDTTAIITWQTDEPGNSQVQYGTSSTWGSYEFSENDAGMSISHTVTLTGLAAENTYYFRVGSTDAAGNGPDLNSNATNPSAQQYFETEPDSDDAAPVISNVSDDVTIDIIKTDTTAVITWTTDEPSNSQVQYQPGSDSTWGVYDSAENDVGMVTSHSVTLTGLIQGTTYYFQVGSTDARGNGPTFHSNGTNPSTYGSFTTTVPDYAAPDIEIPTVEVVGITDTTATVIWETDEPSNSMVRYDTVSRSSWAGYQWSKNDARMVTSHSVTITGLAKDFTYYFRVGSNDASGNGPDTSGTDNNPIPNPPDPDSSFTTTNTDTDPPSITGYSIDYVNNTIEITYDEANMQNATIEANYAFSPFLSFCTSGGSDDITYRGSNTYRLFMAFIPQNTSFIVAVSGITDEAGNPVDTSSITIDITPGSTGIKEALPHHNAGITDSTRVPNNTSFAVRIEIEDPDDGIDTTDPTSIKFTINDGFNPTYDYTLGNTDVVRVVQLDPNELENNVTKLWAIYDRSTDDWHGNTYSVGTIVTISVDAKDKNQNWMDQGVYSFKVETQQQHNDAEDNLPSSGDLSPNDPDLEGSYIYDTGAQVSSGQLNGAKILYDSNEPVLPTFGPINEIPALNISGVNAVGVPMNLQPPTVFNTPVKIFIPCPGHQYASTLSVYRYTGTSWVLACDASGIVQSGGEGWMKPGSRVNYNSGTPSMIEMQVYHFTGVQAGSPGVSVGISTDAAAGGGCFIATAAYGSHMDWHVETLSKFRDRYLSTNSIGRDILKGYYKFSPAVADYLHKHPFARVIVRYALIPITGIAYISLSIHPLALLFAFILLLLTGIYFFKRSEIRRQRSAM